MSFLKHKLGRSAVVVALSVGAFQALAIVAAPVASAAPTCTYSAGTLTITNDVNNSIVAIQQDNVGQVAVFGSGAVLCSGGPILIANLTTVAISGGIGDQEVQIWMSDTGTCGFTALPGASTGPACVPAGAINESSWGKVNWTISLGAENGTSLVTPDGDSLLIYNQGTGHGDALDVALGANGIDLNNDGDLDVTVSSIEHYKVQSDGAGNDVINAGGTTATGAAFTQGLDGILNPADFGIIANNPVGHASCRHEAPPLAGGCHDKTLTGGAGNDRISATGDGYNTVAPGAGDDFMAGAGGATGGNNLDYSASPNAINANFPGDTVNGWGLDTWTPVFGFTDIIGSPQGDVILGGDAEYNYFMPGAGNDTVTGGSTASTDGSFSDAYDVSDAEAAVTVDLAAGTSTGGSGTDTLSGIEDVYGTEADDTISGTASTTVGNYIHGGGGNDHLSGGPANANGPDWLQGGDGIDTVDYGLNTSSTTVQLSQPSCEFVFQDFAPNHFEGTATSGPQQCASDTIPPGLGVPLGAAFQINKSGVGAEGDVLIDIENAILGSANDTFTGSSFNNTVWPNGGQNVLNGCPVVAAGCGIDTVNYSMGYDAGVTVNLAGGGPSGGNADSIVGFTNAVGTPFADDIIGTDANIGNSLKGGKGNDAISGNNGPDFVLGGAGNDAIRGGGGEDSLKGQGGKDNIRGSGGGDNLYGGKGKDYCLGGGGDDLVKTCEKPKDNHGNGPNGPGLHQRL